MKALGIAPLVLVLALPAQSATIHVPADQPTIKAGVEAAAPGDTVEVACGTYHEDDVRLSSDIVLRSETGDPTCVVIDAGGGYRPVRIFSNTFASSAIVEGLTLTGGMHPAGRGGGLYIYSGAAEIRNCVIRANQANFGGGVCVEPGARATFVTCEFIDNAAVAGPGGVGGGGGVYSVAGSPTRFIDCTFSHNTADGAGGGFLLSQGHLPYPPVEATLVGCTFRYNSSATGGALECTKPGARISLESTDFTGNEAYHGGALNLFEQLSILAVGCVFQGNHAVREGGAIRARVNTDITLTDCDIVSNEAERGGALFTRLVKTHLTTCRFTSNFALESGGAMYFAESEVGSEVNECVFAQNSAVYSGGAVLVASNHVAFRNSIFYRNSAQLAGGAVRIFDQDYAASSFSGCTFWSNECPEEGSAIAYDSNPGVTTIEATIFSQNLGAPAITCDSNEPVLKCVDVFGHAGGDWIGCIAGLAGIDGNFSADPSFCDPDKGVFTLQAGSPCSPQVTPAGCGLVGALPPGCGPVALDELSWGELKASYRGER